MSKVGGLWSNLELNETRYKIRFVLLLPEANHPLLPVTRRTRQPPYPLSSMVGNGYIFSLFGFLHVGSFWPESDPTRMLLSPIVLSQKFRHIIETNQYLLQQSRCQAWSAVWLRLVSSDLFIFLSIVNSDLRHVWIEIILSLWKRAYANE